MCDVVRGVRHFVFREGYVKCFFFQVFCVEDWFLVYGYCGCYVSRGFEVYTVDCLMFRTASAVVCVKCLFVSIGGGVGVGAWVGLERCVGTPQSRCGGAHGGVKLIWFSSKLPCVENCIRLLGPGVLQPGF